MEKNQNSTGDENIPYSSSVLVLGILSIALCWCYGIVGVTLGIIALVQSSIGHRAYNESPMTYREGSYQNLKAGRICAIIGLSISGLYMLYFIFVLAFVGAAISAMPWEHLMRK